MTKDESTTAGMQTIESGVKTALDQAFDNGAASVAPTTVGGISPDQEKADIAAAVTAAQTDLQTQIDALKATVASDATSLQAATDLETALQGKLDKIKALLS